jgi:ferritin-like metal-binding protein YciE
MEMTENKLLQYLNEARATETGLVRVLQSQIALTPRGDYRSALERHLRETRQHAARLERRLDELGASKARIQATIGAAETVLAQGLAIGKLPLDLVRGHGGAEKVLKNAKDAAATEALEIATYMAIERLASALGDDATARLAASIRADEERMLATILDLVPTLTDAVLGGRYEVASTGAGETVRRTAGRTRTAAKKTATRAKRTARRAPGAARAAGAAQGAVAAPEDLPIARYDTLNVEQITERLRDLSQTELAKVEAYERRHDNRSTVTERIAALRAREPWPGYDDQNADQVASVLRSAGEDDARRRAAREYERAHKNRTTVLEVV